MNLTEIHFRSGAQGAQGAQIIFTYLFRFQGVNSKKNLAKSLDIWGKFSDKHVILLNCLSFFTLTLVSMIGANIIQLTARVLQEYCEDERGHFGFRRRCEGFVALK